MFLFFYNVSLFIIDLIHLTWRSFLATVTSIYHVVIRPSKKPLDGEIVLITGAAHGIGRELALEFARRGGILVLWDINENGLQQTATDIRKLNGKATYYKCDVRDQEAVKNTARQVANDVGDVSILVNNAGVGYLKSFEDCTPEHIRQTFEVNLLSYFWTVSEFLPKMIRRNQGHIVAMSSITAKFVSPHCVPYCASKFAVAGMMEALGEELRYYKRSAINLTTVFPFFVNTGFVKYPRIKYQWLSPMIEPEVVAQKVVDGVQRNAAHVYIPAYFELFSRLHTLLPRKVMQLIADFVDAGCSPQTDEISQRQRMLQN